MNWLLDWLDDRTGIRDLIHEALYERVPGGARWRYVWGSTLVFAFVTQMVTGVFLWMCYSPSSRTAWESVYFIQYEMQGGWLLRGIHHFMAQAMVVLLALHLLQVVIDGAYKAPREINFWLGLILMQIVLGLSLTGYLLPWDQKGFWATNVATNLMSLVPLVGNQLQTLVVGGTDYGHHTLTRFFALHAGVLPGLLIFFLVLHVALFRKHGITPRESDNPDQYFWPDQVLKDAVACLAVLAVVLLLCFKNVGGDHGVNPVPGDYLGAELSAPADASEQFSAARPEWYFLFLFELLKYFTPETMGSELIGNEFVGAIAVPGFIMGLLFLMPILGNWKLGHGFNVALILALIVGAGFLTVRAIHADRYAAWHTKDPDKFKDDTAARSKYEAKFRASEDYLAAVEQSHREARRIKQVIRERGGIPAEGAIVLTRQDSEIEGRRLFVRNCASCHAYQDADGRGIAGPAPTDDGNPNGAANLFGFASRDWLTGFLDPQHIASSRYFGQTVHAEGEMVRFTEANMTDLDDELTTARTNLIARLSGEAALKYQSDIDKKGQESDTWQAGEEALTETAFADGESCVDCHKFHDAGDLGSAPDLTGYGSLQWLTEIITNPEHERFYESSNDRMPAFAVDPQVTDQNILTEQQIRLIARWLRGDDR